MIEGQQPRKSVGPAGEKLGWTPGYEVRLIPSPGSATNVDIIQRFGAGVLTDVEFGWQATPSGWLSIGADNAFDVCPDENNASAVAAGVDGWDNARTQPRNTAPPSASAGVGCSRDWDQLAGTMPAIGEASGP